MIRIRPLASADLDSILAIAAASPEASAWSSAAYEQFLQDAHPAACLVAELEGSVAGFICFRVVSDEAEVLNLAVLPKARRRGVGSRLLAEVIRQARARGARGLFLEVRATNQSAIRLYERHCFRVASHRSGYYGDPPADALVLVCNLLPEQNP